ncbi:unnamed protein product [Owenia fusiformis]|uniref:Uncharacterized protein n=1 Tax=Owenia fusiformis TaxID=6347 RepID=A0A8J1YCY2_OWEFU|nr:unnamed protein product [Owenia fusiformis]
MDTKGNLANDCVGTSTIEYDPNDYARINKLVSDVICKVQKFKYTHNTNIRLWTRVFLVLAYSVYFGYAIFLDFHKNVVLLGLTAGFVGIFVLHILHSLFSGCFIRWCHRLQKRFHECIGYTQRRRLIVSLKVLTVLVILGVTFVDVWQTPLKIVSLFGIMMILGIGVLFSHNKVMIRWDIVYSGVLLQFLIGLLLLRWKTGSDAMSAFSGEITRFLAYSRAGLIGVFGESWTDHFIFRIVGTATFFAAVNATLYHFGVMQACIKVIGGLIAAVVPVVPAEAFVATANIFLGTTGSAMTVLSLLDDMTISELHVVLTCGLASISGGGMAMFISIGVPGSSLIGASMMSAPAALVMSKLLRPETKRSRIQAIKEICYFKEEVQNLLHAIIIAVGRIPRLLGQIVATLIGFVAMRQFLNEAMKWTGGRIGIEGLNFETICAYLFSPLALMIGVDVPDVVEVGNILGTSTILSGLVAFVKISDLIKNRIEGKEPYLSPRSEILGTYAICNMASITGLAINIATVGSLAPRRKEDISKIALSSFVAACLACLMTASVAGVLYQESDI